MIALLIAASIAATAAAAGSTVERREYTCYFLDIDEKLTDPISLYFMDGVDDLPYFEIKDVAELLYFLSREMNNDEGFGMTIQYNGTDLTLERENGYTAKLDFENNTIKFDDYNAFLHQSTESTLIDLLSEWRYDEDGQAQLFARDTKSSFERYGMRSFSISAATELN